jgi:hypothetical protein
MAFAESRWCGQWQAGHGVGREIHYTGALYTTFITDAYIPSIEAVLKERLSQRLKRRRSLYICKFNLSIPPTQNLQRRNTCTSSSSPTTAARIRILIA